MRYYVIAPDSSGGKGDEAMMRGVLNVLHGADITILTTPSYYYTWQTELLDRCSEFTECIVPFEDICAGISGKGTLIVIGADVLDGTCGVAPAMSRLCAMNKMLRLGGEVYAMGSFRSDVDTKIIQEIRKIGDRVHWFLREDISVENFRRQTDIDGEFFPDLAYYCEKNESAVVDSVKRFLQEKKIQGKTIVGLNFSQQSCNSFFGEKNDASRTEYVRGVLEILNEEIEQPYYVLISHDVRKYEDHWSDSQFQEIAASIMENHTYLMLKDDITYPELLVLLSEFDYIISGRMHLAVASLRSGLVPIIYTGAGNGGKFSMAEKCRGMLDMRIGKPELVASNPVQLREALRIVKDDMFVLKERLEKQNLENVDIESELAKKFRVLLKMDSVYPEISTTNVEAQEVKALRSMVRSALMLQEKNMHSLQEQLNEKGKQIENMKEMQQEILGMQQKQWKQDVHIDNCSKQMNIITDLVSLYEGRINRLNNMLEEFEKKHFDLYIENCRLSENVNNQEKEICKLRRLLPIRLWCKLRGVR